MTTTNEPDRCPASKYGDSHDWKPKRDGRTAEGEPAFIIACARCGVPQKEWRDEYQGADSD